MSKGILSQLKKHYPWYTPGIYAWYSGNCELFPARLSVSRISSSPYHSPIKLSWFYALTRATRGLFPLFIFALFYETPIDRKHWSPAFLLAHRSCLSRCLKNERWPTCPIWCIPCACCYACSFVLVCGEGRTRKISRSKVICLASWRAPGVHL